MKKLMVSKIRGMRMLPLAIAAFVAGGLYGRAVNVDLNGTWKLETFAQPDDGAVRSLPLPAGLALKSYQATVPGCCEMELVKAGEMPDPMFSTNALAFTALEGNQWLYTKTFTCPPRELGERAVLVFDGIDTLADVFLNGEKVGEADNMLIPHEFDVTDRIRVGAENTVQVLIRPVGLAARDKIPGELGWMMGGGANHEFFRKAPHMYGWDIMPHMPFSGIWRGARLEVRPKCHIDYPAWIVRAIGVKHRWADVHVRMRITTPFSVFYKAKVRATLSRNGKVHSKEVPFRGPMCKLQVGLTDADFWWPRGMGDPALYDAKIELISDDGKVLAVDERKIGIRQFAFEYDDVKLPERPGKFLFRVNGEPVFIRGVDWVPLDPIPSRQASHLEKVLPMMADLNCNLVRVWGGGVYEPDAFFDWCDANGVMVWQDFMMACAVPPMVDEFAEAMKKEVLSVVLRLRNRASLMAWAGDNENDEAVVWSLGDLAPSPATFRITRKVIPDILREYDVTRPYLPSSPYRTDDCHFKRTRTAETHLWGGPRAWWKTDYYTNNPSWFSSEAGAHALPSRATFDRMMPAADVLKPWSNPDEKDYLKLQWTPQWVYRATNPYLDKDNRGLVHRNDHVLKQTGALFGDVPRHDVDLLIEQSQTAQAEAIKFLVELYRSQKFTKKTGFVEWNLRDGWPTISDAISDYYGNKKKSYHYLKRAFQTVLPIVTDFGRLVVVNDSREAVKGHVKLTEAATGKVVLERDYEAAPNAVTDLAPVAWNGQGLFIIDYTVDDGRNKLRPSRGETYRTHYLHGEPPFKWSDYLKWTKEL